MFAYEKSDGTTSAYQTSGAFKGLSNGSYRVKFYITEGENYLQSNEVTSSSWVDVALATSPGEYKSITYYVDNYTADVALAGTGNTVTVTNCTYGEKVVAD